MTFWQRARRLFGRPDVTLHSIPEPVVQAVRELTNSAYGSSISRAEALTVPAVQRGRNLICSVSTLPLVQHGPDNTVIRNPLLEQIDPDVPNVVTLAQTLEDLLFEAIAWWQITGYGYDGYPMTARRLDPAIVSMTPPSGRSPSPLPAGYDPRGALVYVDGRPVDGRDIIRFDSPNPAVLKVGGRAIRRAILLDLAAKMYAEDPRPLDFFTPSDNQTDPVDDDEIAEILSQWQAERRKRGTAYVPAALRYNAVQSPTPADLQLVALQERAALEIANALGVDPEELGVSTTSRTYANVIDRRRDRINDVLAPFMRAITDRLSMGDVTRRGYTVRFDLDDYLKSNPTERWNTYKIAKEIGALTVEEIRAEEGLPPLPAGADPAPSGAPSDANASPDQGQPQAAAPSGAGADANASRPALTFDGRMTLTADVPVEQFSVNAETRIVEGLAAPYGRVAGKGGMKYKFAKDSLRWTDPGRVKLLRDHDPGQPLGRAEVLKSTPAGLLVRFKVARGEAGDAALALAEDGVLDGFSVGVDFDMSADTELDGRDKTVTLVRRADLREVSLTAMPAFDDARVTKVAASLTEGAGMPEETEPLTPAPTVAPAGAGLTFTPEQVAALLGQPNGLAQIAMPPRPEPEQRQVVNPVRTAAAFVTEPAPYRFDRLGNILRGSHEFSSDLFAGGKGDAAALDRATAFVRAQFDVATTDVNELNPTRNRPEMYVDQRDYKYPVWDAINKGTLGDVTPFTFPKFSSASGLVGAHTQGNEPSSGTFVTTLDTVTPTALSGKAKITRETMDQGGNPQISNLIWRQMTKGWYEALEAAAVAILDAASPTQIDLSGTPGLADDDLDQALSEAFALLQYVRGGFSMDTMFTQVDLFKSLVSATDTTGRRLYPAIGPMNAAGTVGNRYGALSLNGVTALPAWALAATGTVAASSYLFDRDVVWGWASAPQRLQFDYEVAHVYIGIWGYKATVISDLAGVREIVYDPA